MDATSICTSAGNKSGPVLLNQSSSSPDQTFVYIAPLKGLEWWGEGEGEFNQECNIRVSSFCLVFHISK